MIDRFKWYAELAKIRITVFVAFSSAIGFVLYNGEIDNMLVISSLGVFLLACGASALNHFQERKTDALMERTKNRPIPSGKVLPVNALIYSVLLLLLGSFLLYYYVNVQALILGLICFVWYNIIYTPLKRKYAMAVVPGSVIGALPPVIGWVAAGGTWYEPQIMALALFFFIWQIPHFWLLLLLFGKDYEEAGFPTLTQIFSDLQLTRITFIWIAALSISSILIPLFDVSQNVITVSILLILAVWLLIESRKIFSGYLEKLLYRKAFININLYVLLVVILLSLDKLIL